MSTENEPTDDVKRSRLNALWAILLGRQPSAHEHQPNETKGDQTVVIHPASTTHGQLTPEEQQTAGVTEDYVRLSVGLEDVADIEADIDQALQKAVS